MKKYISPKPAHTNNIKRRQDSVGKPTSDYLINKGIKSSLVNRKLYRRFRKQRNCFVDLAKNVHIGGKEELKAAIALEISSSRRQKTSDLECNGSINKSDLINILKWIPGDEQSLLEEVVLEHFFQFPKVSALDVIKLASTYSPLQVVNVFRKLLPDEIASEKEVRVAHMIVQSSY